VSPVTVSRVLRNPTIVSLDLRRRVEEAIRDLAYIPNNLASSLASSRTHRIGVVVPSLTNGVFGDYIQSIHAVLEPAGFQVLVLNSSYEAEMEERAIATMLGQHPEAMIVTGISQTERARKMLVQAAIPVVQTLEITDEPIDIAIGLSQRNAGYDATRYLISLGHRRIAHLAAPLDERSRLRMSGYHDALAEAKLEPIVVGLDKSSSFAVGAQLFAGLYSQHPDITALFCGNDNLALGSIFEAERMGVRVPGDLSIIGFNDLEFAAVSKPSLTTIMTPREAIGRRAAEIVLEIVRGSGERPHNKNIDVGFRLIERESTAALAR
jgi:LacI family gluconate utilization system Gnt-I transcriptional repressor